MALVDNVGSFSSNLLPLLASSLIPIVYSSHLLRFVDAFPPSLHHSPLRHLLYISHCFVSSLFKKDSFISNSCFILSQQLCLVLFPRCVSYWCSSLCLSLAFACGYFIGPFVLEQVEFSICCVFVWRLFQFFWLFLYFHRCHRFSTVHQNPSVLSAM